MAQDLSVKYFRLSKEPMVGWCSMAWCCSMLTSSKESTKFKWKSVSVISLGANRQTRKKKGGALETAKQQRRFQDQAQSLTQSKPQLYTSKKHGCRHLRQTWGILKGVLSEHRWYLGQRDSPIPLPPRSSTKCSRRARRRELALQLEIAWRRWHTL